MDLRQTPVHRDTLVANCHASRAVPNSSRCPAKRFWFVTILRLELSTITAFNKGLDSRDVFRGQCCRVVCRARVIWHCYISERDVASTEGMSTVTHADGPGKAVARTQTARSREKPRGKSMNRLNHQTIIDRYRSFVHFVSQACFMVTRNSSESFS